MVSIMGTVVFDLSLSFTQSGPSMNTQSVTQYSLKNGSRTSINCQSGRCSSFEDHWWTVEDGSVFVLHQAKSNDRGIYTGEVEVRHPKDNSLNTLTKHFHVTCKCLYFIFGSLTQILTFLQLQHVRSLILALRMDMFRRWNQLRVISMEPKQTTPAVMVVSFREASLYAVSI